MPCNLIAEAGHWLDQIQSSMDWPHFSTASVTALALVSVAEFGDKSQLVCMALASRHRHWPVLWGAMVAFALLNAIAVTFGTVAGQWLPERTLAALVAILFIGFGIHSLVGKDDADGESFKEKSGHGIFVTTFLMIFLAEFGDKTQLAVVGLGAAEPAAAVWFGATLALTLTSALGIWAGKTILRNVSQRSMHFIAGLLFLAFGGVAAIRALPPELWQAIGAIIPSLSAPAPV